MRMTGHEVRRSFVGYFKKNGHETVKSSGLIPENDDTLLFANAGMNQFKNLFLGLEKRKYNRAVTVQKCVRAGGKHNDLENVGFTARHHTFFEMLGNFSFGDYFKKDAIHFAWELLTKDLEIPKDKLFVTVYTDDDEAADIWHNQEGVPRERISRFEADNFWMMGDTGPCGPCSEIFYDHGPKAGCGKPDCKVGCSCDRYVEIWNLVFMQFNSNPDGSRTKLPKPSVDTGGGLERMTAVMQGVVNNYETDLFSPLIEVSANKIDRKLPFSDKDRLAACRVLADHARASAFLIADGVLPANEGRGYVLRRIMRRGILYGRKLNLDNALLLPTVKKVIDTMSVTYPELSVRSEAINAAVKDEEIKFLSTIDKGIDIFNDEVSKVKKSGKEIISGDSLFKLYDTFGFPMDLTRVLATENGLKVDEKGFESLMEKAKETSRASWKGGGVTANEAHLIEFVQKQKKTKFTGYKGTEGSGKVTALSDGSKTVNSLKAGQSGVAALDTTAFYGESGGQVGDKGTFKAKNLEVEVTNTTKLNDIYLHHVTVKSGELKKNAKVEMLVNESERRSTARNHSATHLMHAALREVLGKHVSQAGSLVDARRTRFDFTHSKAMSSEEIKKVEDLVNREISAARNVSAKEMEFDKAVKSGAMALFGEKYGKKVRVLKMGEFSTELCGGTHVGNTSEIRLFKIVSEGGVSAGVRRIEAITNDIAFEFLNRNTEENIAAGKRLGTYQLVFGEEIPASKATTLDGVEKLFGEIKNKEKQVKQAAKQGVDVNSLLGQATEFSGGKKLLTEVDVEDREVLRNLSDQLRDKLQPAVVVLVGKGNDSRPIFVSVSKEISQKFNAGKILQVIAEEMGGKGGGRPDFAQGAGRDPSKLDSAFKKAQSLLN